MSSPLAKQRPNSFLYSNKNLFCLKVLKNRGVGKGKLFEKSFPFPTIIPYIKLLACLFNSNCNSNSHTNHGVVTDICGARNNLKIMTFSTPKHTIYVRLFVPFSLAWTKCGREFVHTYYTISCPLCQAYDFPHSIIPQNTRLFLFF